MDAYREKVRRLAAKADGETIYNATEEHAAIIVEELFRSAKDHVHILTGHLSPRIFCRARVLEWMKVFASDPDHKIRVSVDPAELENLRENEAFKTLKGRSNVEFRARLPEDDERISFRYVVTDGNSYRFEIDKTKCAAIAAFGDQDFGGDIHRSFDLSWQDGQRFDLDKLEIIPSTLFPQDGEASSPANRG